MSHIRSKDTGPERVLRMHLFRAGFRYRLYVKALPGTPDIVLPGCRTVIFVNGCFWHGHKGCRMASIPKTNTGFWHTKIQRNISRDERNTALLEALGWNVVTVLECELQPAKVEETVHRLCTILRVNADCWRSSLAARRKAAAISGFEAKVSRRRRSMQDASLRERFHVPDRIRKLSRNSDDTMYDPPSLPILETLSGKRKRR